MPNLKGEIYGPVADVFTAGRGGFFGGTINLPPVGVNTAVLSAANQVRVYEFVLPFNTLVRKLAFNVTTLFAGGNCGVGIYSAAGNLLVNSGAVSTASTGNKTATLATPVLLTPGTYFLAWTGDNTTFTLLGFTVGSLEGLMRANNANRNGIAANASSGGVLPATLGAITGGGFNPAAVFFEP